MSIDHCIIHIYNIWRSKQNSITSLAHSIWRRNRPKTRSFRCGSHLWWGEIHSNGCGSVPKHNWDWTCNLEPLLTLITGKFRQIRDSRCWLNFAVIAGLQLNNRDFQYLPSCHDRCGGRRDIVNALTIFTCNGCPKSSRVSQNLTIDFSSSRVSSCSFTCGALLGCAHQSRFRKVPYSIPYVDAAARIDGSRHEQYACLALWISFSLSIAASLHFTLPMVALLQGESENWVCVRGN
jgi:hypothetical protein